VGQPAAHYTTQMIVLPDDIAVLAGFTSLLEQKLGEDSVFSEDDIQQDKQSKHEDIESLGKINSQNQSPEAAEFFLKSVRQFTNDETQGEWTEDHRERARQMIKCLKKIRQQKDQMKNTNEAVQKNVSALISAHFLAQKVYQKIENEILELDSLDADLQKARAKAREEENMLNMQIHQIRMNLDEYESWMEMKKSAKKTVLLEHLRHVSTVLESGIAIAGHVPSQTQLHFAGNVLNQNAKDTQEVPKEAKVLARIDGKGSAERHQMQNPLFVQTAKLVQNSSKLSEKEIETFFKGTDRHGNNFRLALHTDLGSSDDILPTIAKAQVLIKCTV
jgi:hypothetical protein